MAGVGPDRDLVETYLRNKERSQRFQRARLRFLALVAMFAAAFLLGVVLALVAR